MTTQWWHAYGREVEEYGAFMTLIVGPTPKGPDDLDKNGTVIKKAVVNDAPYLGSFDHEPTELEKDRLRLEEFRELDDNGVPLEPLLEVVRSNDAGLKVTTHHPISELINDSEY